MADTILEKCELGVRYYELRGGGGGDTLAVKYILSQVLHKEYVKCNAVILDCGRVSGLCSGGGSVV